MKLKQLLILSILASLTQTANAHTGVHPVDGWLSGFVHPLLGLDHLLAMVGVGLWAVFATPKQCPIWRLPLMFVTAMVFGGILGASGLSMPGTEIGIAASVLWLGFMITGMARLPNVAAIGLIGLFALFHGFAHGQEMAQDENLFAYASGFVVSTGLLHLAGIVLGQRLLHHALAYRASGAVIGGMGLILLAQAI